MSRVKNKAALITGGASGLGLASGKLLLEQGAKVMFTDINQVKFCLLYTSPSPRDGLLSRMPSSA